MSARSQNLTASIDAYWKKFYEKESSLALEPSSFAKEVARKISGVKTLVDCGCGSGRDTIFFADVGLKAIGVDGSFSAIELALKNAENTSSICDFKVVDFSNPLQVSEFIDYLSGEKERPMAIYARFFLHAIPIEAEKLFLDFAAKILSPGEYLFLEFRLAGDEQLPKHFGTHFRRFLSLEYVVAEILKRGFKLANAVASTGLSVYQGEDPLLGRIAAVKNQL